MFRSSSSRSVTYGQLVRQNRDFRLYWGGQIVSQLGDWFSTITVQALLLKYTGSAEAVGWFMIAQMLPGFLLGPLAGVVVDRLPRKTVMIGADLVRAVVALGLLGFRGAGTAWVAYACLAGLSSLTAFFEPARISTLPNITSEDELVSANALSSVTWSILLTSGAVVGALVGHFFGTDVAFILNGLSFVGSALFLSRMRVPPHPPSEGREGGFGQLIGGFRYVAEHPEIAGALTAKLGWGLAGGIQVLLSVMGAQLFPLPRDPNGQLSIGLLFAAGGLGTGLGPVLAQRLTGSDLPKIRWAIALSFLMAALYLTGMAFGQNLAVVAGFLLLARMHGAVIWVFSTILLQILTKDRYRGRVFAAETSLFTASMMLSSVLVGHAVRPGPHALLAREATQAILAAAAISTVVGLLWVARLALGRLPEPADGPLPTPAPDTDPADARKPRSPRPEEEPVA